MTDVKLPPLGEEVKDGCITKWLVAEGAMVEKDQPLLEVATDKADMELPCPASGRLVKILVAVGDYALVGETIAQIADPIVIGEPAFVRLLRDEDDF